MKRRISLVVGSAALAGATAALAVGGTHAFADSSAIAADASGPGMSATLSIASLPSLGALPTIDSGSIFGSAQQVAQSLGLPLPPLPVNLPPAANQLISDPTGFVTGIAQNPMSVLNVIDVSSILAPVQGVTGGLGNPANILSMLPDPNALLGSLPGLDVLNGLIGSSALSGVVGTVTGIAGNPASLVSSVTGDPLGAVTGLVGDPTSILSGIMSNPTGSLSSVLSMVGGLDPTGLVGGLMNGLGGNPLNAVTGVVNNPTGAASGLLNTAAGLDPTGTLPGVVNTVTGGRKVLTCRFFLTLTRSGRRLPTGICSNTCS